jgi:NodT family efflux transporter outer membrane factor (OMF) lipoprotein
MTKLTAFLISFIFLLSGCVQKQSTRHKNLKVSDSWHNKSEMQNISTSEKIPELQIYWWKNFKDPQLNKLIDLATENNLENKIAIARVKQARADSNVTYTDLLPELNPTESYSYSKKITSGATSSKTRLITTELDLSWELDFFGKQRHLTQSDVYSTMSYESDRDQIMLTLVSDLIANYIDYAKTIELITIHKKTLEESKHSFDIAKSKHLSGITHSLELEAERANYIQSSSKLNDLQTAAKKTLYKISTLCGIPAGQLALDDKEIAIPKIKEKIFLDTPLNIIRQRPDIKKAEYILLSSTSATKSSIASQYPHISLAATIGYQDSNTSSPTGSWSISQSLLAPILNFKKIRETIKSQEAQEEQSFLSYQKAILTAIEEIESNLASYNDMYKNYNNALKITKSRAHILEMTNHLYDSKTKSYQDVITARKELLTAKTILAEKLAAISINTVKLYKALGYKIGNS